MRDRKQERMKGEGEANLKDTSKTVRRAEREKNQWNEKEEEREKSRQKKKREKRWRCKQTYRRG